MTSLEMKTSIVKDFLISSVMTSTRTTFSTCSSMDQLWVAWEDEEVGVPLTICLLACLICRNNMEEGMAMAYLANHSRYSEDQEEWHLFIVQIWEDLGKEEAISMIGGKNKRKKRLINIMRIIPRELEGSTSNKNSSNSTYPATNSSKLYSSYQWCTSSCTPLHLQTLVKTLPIQCKRLLTIL